MREIKFRAWDGGEMVYEMYPQKFNPLETLTQMLNDPLVKLMQYTGLKDENGKDIYEGDILTDGYSFAAVEWTDGGICVNGGEYGIAYTGWICDFYADGNDCGLCAYKNKIAGNIYENEGLI